MRQKRLLTQSRLMEVKLVVPEEAVGGILFDLEGRVLNIQVGKIVKVPFNKNRVKRRKKYKKRKTVEG